MPSVNDGEFAWWDKSSHWMWIAKWMHEGTCLTMIEIHERNMSTFHEVGINEEDYDSESGEGS